MTWTTFVKQTNQNILWQLRKGLIPYRSQNECEFKGSHEKSGTVIARIEKEMKQTFLPI